MIEFLVDSGLYKFEMQAGHYATFTAKEKAQDAFDTYHKLVSTYGPLDAKRGAHVALLKQCKEISERAEKLRMEGAEDAPPEGCIYLNCFSRKSKPRGERARVFGRFGPVFTVEWCAPNEDGTWNVFFKVEAAAFIDYLERIVEITYKDASVIHSQGPFSLCRERGEGDFFRYCVAKDFEYIGPTPGVDPFIENTTKHNPLVALCLYHRLVNGQAFDTHSIQHQATPSYTRGHTSRG